MVEVGKGMMMVIGVADFDKFVRRFSVSFVNDSNDSFGSDAFPAKDFKVEDVWVKSGGSGLSVSVVDGRLSANDVLGSQETDFVRLRLECSRLDDWVIGLEISFETEGGRSLSKVCNLDLEVKY